MNVFKKILAGQIPCKKVLENEHFLCFHDIAPQAKVHVLVISKRSLRDFNACDGELLAHLPSFVHQVVEILGIKESGYKLLTNTGIDGGQEVPHLHFHILGGERIKSRFN
ncbi:MAG: histidine triad nucleotide-binding protein [Helicobacter sp.]|nr:histidine triad nucleotide-binding protein [Helicobacter sp.]